MVYSNDKVGTENTYALSNYNGDFKNKGKIDIWQSTRKSGVEKKVKYKIAKWENTM